ncbi:MAG TPA: aminotransferase class V-fold PLP-dependent enzyme [Gemmatimonadales bacterium]|nr:aminotransferase class V-fold PLP-dependent enzyme [Gemmatimonadales bacterium]
MTAVANETSHSEMLARLERPLRHLFRTTRPILIADSAAHGMMEAAVRNGVHERMLAVVGGAEGEEFARVAEACGKEVVRAFVRPGETIQARHLSRFLEGPGVDAVSLAHVEPATGAVAPLQELARVTRAAADVLLFVDARFSLGAEGLEFDLWQLDFALAGSGGPLGLPPGLSLGAASKRLMARAESLGDRGWYFDLARLEREIRARRLTHPPSTSVLLELERMMPAL